MRQVDVLIVDDDRDFAEFVAEVAEGIGLATLIVTDPDQFQKAFEKGRPRIVVLDLHMPGTDGFQIAQSIGKLVENNDVECRLIILSGLGPDAVRMSASVASLSGLDDVFTFNKPVEVATLEAAFKV